HAAVATWATLGEFGRVAVPGAFLAAPGAAVHRLGHRARTVVTLVVGFEFGAEQLEELLALHGPPVFGALGGRAGAGGLATDLERPGANGVVGGFHLHGVAETLAGVGLHRAAKERDHVGVHLGTKPIVPNGGPLVGELRQLTGEHAV